MKYTVPNPDLETRIRLIEIYTKKRQVDDQIPKENLANAFETLSSSAVETILNEAQMLATLNNHDKILEDDLILASNKTNLPINISKLRRKK
jgi:cell division protease FtsH